MGLYNNVSDSIAALAGNGNLLGRLDDSVRHSTAAAGKFASTALGGGRLATAIGSAAGSMGGAAISNKINSHIPASARNAINAAGKAGSQLLSGDWESAVLTGAEAGAFDRLLGEGLGGALGSGSSQGRYWGTGNRLYGGISPADAKQMYAEIISARRAKKNLFLVEVGSPLSGDFSQMFNLFCTDVEITPMNITGDKRRVGGASVDSPQSSEAVELRITTLDDQEGSLKRWFEEHAAAVAASDGTFGVPANYAITFTLRHAFVGEAARAGFASTGLYRAVSYDYSLSRREDALEELQMTFTQLDTFMRP